MNSLQSELDKINQQLELLTYRKQQLDSIMAEYSDVVNRVKNLIDSMQDAMVEPSNLLMEIEGIIHGEPELTPIENLIKEQSEHIEEQPTVEPLYGVDCSMFDDDDDDDDEPEPTPEPTPQPTSNPELVKLMACVPVATEPTPIKTRLNDQACRRNDTLLIGFTNKRLMNSWEKWFKNNWGDSVKVWNDETLDGFTHCLSVLWYGPSKFIDWERLTKLNYSFKPDEQPSGIKLDDVRKVIKTLQNSGLKFISKGELLAHHLNTLKASDLEDYLEQLMSEGLIALGNKSIDLLPAKTQDNEPDNPTFEYTEVDEKTTKIYNDGMLLGIAKNCGTHWETPQLPGETFPNRRDVVAGLWQLVNQF